ncbi:hypothetical protein ACLQ2R_28925 [Streptosporangium sp. DT93]|uniref:hypothetical protein n=1 Tax=Streptosporangium sp. DT93 TaxID=3393428 RepID=UPI003CF27628
MTTWTEARDALADDLERLVGNRLLDPLDILFGTADLMRDRLASQARAWAGTLLGPDDQAAAYTAIRLVSALYPGDAPFDPPTGWWGTPFGQAVLLRAGHPSAAVAVPVAVAADMLGITRQGVHDLASRGKLERLPPGITVASVRARLAARAPVITREDHT